MHISNALLLLLVSSLLGHIACYVCDAAYFYRCCTFHGGLFTSLSVCLFVRVSDTGVILQKTAESIELPFEEADFHGSRNHVLDGAACIRRVRLNDPFAAAMRAGATITVATC